jgi:putative transposase
VSIFNSYSLIDKVRSLIPNFDSFKISKLTEKELKNTEGLGFLKYADSTALQQARKNFDNSKTNFFKFGRGKPVFKSKNHGNNSYRTTSKKVDFSNNLVFLPKIGYVKYRSKYKLLGLEDRILSKTVSRVADKYFVSLTVKNIPVKSLPKTKLDVGIDLGIKDIAVFSDGFKSGKIPFIYEINQRIDRGNQVLSNKQVGSNNFLKAKTKLQNLYYKKTCIVRDFLHKLTKDIVVNYDKIFVGNVNSQLGLKNCNLARSTSDSHWFEFKRMLEYKSDWYDKEFEIVNESYTSKTCNVCGGINKDLKLSVRNWTCPVCNTEHDRDVNAAKNIRTVGTTGIAFGKTNN